MISKKLNIFLDLEKNDYRKYIEIERQQKIEKYIKKRKEDLDEHKKNFNYIEPLKKLYDLWHDFSNMGNLSEKNFWKCMKLLNYPFSKIQTKLHHCFYSIFCFNGKMNHTEFLNVIYFFKNNNTKEQQFLFISTLCEKIKEDNINILEKICNNIDINNEYNDLLYSIFKF